MGLLGGGDQISRIAPVQADAVGRVDRTVSTTLVKMTIQRHVLDKSHFAPLVS